MSQTINDVDESTLAQASQVLGTQSPVDTVNAALRDVVRRRMVQEYVEYMKDRDVNKLSEDRASAWR